MDKVLYDAGDIASDLSVSQADAEGLLRELCRRMEKSGLYVIKGKIPRAYYEKQKNAGFIQEIQPVHGARVPVNEKRLLSIEEFCEYAGGIGICTARRCIRQIGAEVRIGSRCLVDRKKFDQWCDGKPAAL